MWKLGVYRLRQRIRIAIGQNHGFSHLPATWSTRSQPHAYVARQNLIRSGRVDVALCWVERITLEGNQFQAICQHAVIER